VEKQFQNHIIICGLGATAVQIIEELESYLEKTVEKTTMIGEVKFRDYLVIENSSGAIEKTSMKWPNIHYLGVMQQMMKYLKRPVSGMPMVFFQSS